MLSPEGGSTFQGAQTALKQNCFSVFWCMTRTWAALSSAHRWAGAACSPQPEHHHWESSPTAHLVLLSLCHPAKLEPSTPNSTQVTQGCRQAPPNCLHHVPDSKQDRGIVNLSGQPHHRSYCFQPWYKCSALPFFTVPTMLQKLSLNKGLAQLKTPWANKPHSSKLWVQVTEKGKVGNLFSWTVSDDGWMRGITDL